MYTSLHLCTCLKWHSFKRHIILLIWSEGAKSDNKTHVTCLCLSSSMFIWPDLDLLSLTMEIVLWAYFLHIVHVESNHFAFHTTKCLFTLSRCHNHHFITQVDQIYRIALEISLGKLMYDIYWHLLEIYIRKRPV